MKDNSIFGNQTPDLVPVSKFNEFIQYPSVGAIRQYIFYNTDGFKDNVVRYLGKRQYIKISAFWDWVERNNNIRIA